MNARFGRTFAQLPSEIYAGLLSVSRFVPELSLNVSDTFSGVSISLQ